MSQIGPEIKRLMNVGGLTVADVSHWLDEPRSTVNGWVNMGVTPHYLKHFKLWIKINHLREVVTRARGDVIPLYVGSRSRKAYLIKLRDR